MLLLPSARAHNSGNSSSACAGPAESDSLVLPCDNPRPSKALRLDAECPRHFIRLKVRMPNAKREVKSYPRRCSRRTPGVSLPLQLLCTSEATVEHVEDHPSGREIR